VFARGATKVEVSLDFMRKVGDSGPRVGAPAPPASRTPTPIPRRLPGAGPRSQ
jgi:hypothetical protein